ncbi:MAG TPA: hypothetical protein VGJ88_00235 [Thermoanaerobaculia bacterium]|jgi:hypothetical protein
MTFIKNQAVDPTTAPAADTPQPPVTMLDPEALVQHFRELRSQIEGATPLSTVQKRRLHNVARKQSAEVIASSINVMGALDNVSQAIGQPAESARQLQTDWNRWTAVADELRGLLNGVESANLGRRQELQLIAAQAFSIGSQLARNPANAVLLPHIAEVKRLKNVASRKKTAGTPQTPSPNAAPAPKA